MQFRVWDGQNMVYERYRHSEYILTFEGEVKELISSKAYTFLDDRILQPPPIAMLCAAMTDKHGYVIYEGDIVSVQNRRTGAIHSKVVEFDDGRFRPITDENEIGDSLYVNIQVLGNIYQNPELVKKYQRPK